MHFGHWKFSLRVFGSEIVKNNVRSGFKVSRGANSCLSAAVVSEKWVKNLPHFKGILEQFVLVTLFMVPQ